MKKSIHSESEMVKAVKELESGVSAEVVARDHGITRATLYNWKSKYSGMDVSQVKRLKERYKHSVYPAWMSDPERIYGTVQRQLQQGCT